MESLVRGRQGSISGESDCLLGIGMRLDLNQLTQASNEDFTLA